MSHSASLHEAYPAKLAYHLSIVSLLNSFIELEKQYSDNMHLNFALSSSKVKYSLLNMAFESISMDGTHAGS